MKLTGPRGNLSYDGEGDGRSFRVGPDGEGHGRGNGLNNGEGWGDGDDICNGNGDGGFDLGFTEIVYARAPVTLTTRSFDGHLINMLLRSV